jgi:M6 family metalloprotease-like protein
MRGALDVRADLAMARIASLPMSSTIRSVLMIIATSWLAACGSSIDEPGESLGSVAQPLATTGNRPMALVLCQFPDDGPPRYPVGDYQGLLTHTEWSLNHYLRQVSASKLSVDGSVALGWYRLPKPESAYWNGGVFDIATLNQDCAALAQGSVNLWSYSPLGIGVQRAMGLGAFYTSQSMTLNGRTSTMPIIFGDGESLASPGNLIHEYGHALDFRHASTVGCPDYSTFYDPMGRTSGLNKSPWGSEWPPHFSAFNKLKAGWIHGSKRVTLTSGASAYLEPASVISPAAYALAELAVPGSSQPYVMELRRKTPGSSYEQGLPSEGVVLYRVHSGQYTELRMVNQQPGCGDDALMAVSNTLNVGESHFDHVNGIRIGVLAEYAAGAVVYADVQPLSWLAVEISGSGSVSATPVGQRVCTSASRCSFSVYPGFILTLIATAAEGHRFTGWSNCPYAEGATCSASPGNQGIRANFALQPTCRVDSACQNACYSACLRSGDPPLLCRNSCRAECTFCQ